MNMYSKPLFIISMLSATSVYSASESFYLGLNVGQTSYDATLDDVAFLNEGSITSASLDDRTTNVRVTLGFRINSNFYLEGGFTNFGDLVVNTESDGTGPVYAAGPVTLRLNTNGLFFDVKGLFPLNERFNLLGKIGYLEWDSDFQLSDSTGNLFNNDDDGGDLFYGVGGSFNISNGLSLNFDYIFYELEDLNANVASIGIQLGF